MTLRNLRRNLRRSLLMGATIASAYMGMLLMFAYIDRVDQYLMVNSVYINHSGHVRIYKAGGLENFFQKPRRYLLNPEDVAALQELVSREVSSLEKMAPYIEGMGLASNSCQYQPFRLKGISIEQDQWMRSHAMVQKWTPELLNLKKGQPFSAIASKKAVLVTAGLAHVLSKPLVMSEVLATEFPLITDCGTTQSKTLIQQSPEVQLLGQAFEGGMNAAEVQIGGHYSTGLALTEDSGLQVPLETAQELYLTSGVTYLGLFLNSDSQASSVSRHLNRVFEKGGLPYEAHPFSDEKVSLFYAGTMNFLYAMSGFFFLLITMVIVISIANSVGMNIFDRIRELGTMRALGFTPRQISILMAKETVALTLMGTVAGYLLSLVIAFLVNAANIRFHPPGIAGDMQFVLIVMPLRALQLFVPILTVSFLTSVLVTQAKMKSKIAELLTD
jgi:putative ABC transport system permease protein